jgi:hypothetical protein
MQGMSMSRKNVLSSGNSAENEGDRRLWPQIQQGEEQGRGVNDGRQRDSEREGEQDFKRGPDAQRSCSECGSGSVYAISSIPSLRTGEEWLR